MHNDAKQFWNTKYNSRAIVSPLDFTKKSLQYLKQGQFLLDVGCGDGRDADFFAKNGITVTAIDFSVEAIERVQKLNAQVTAQTMDILHIDFPDNTFDAIYAHLSLHYFDDETTDKIFQDIFRMLKPKGYFFVKCKSIHDPLYGQGEKVGENMFINPYLRHFFSKEYMHEKLRNFSILDLRETHAAYDGKDSAFIEAIAQREP